MIAVIADDLTGAAELGGVGLRYNLNVEIATEVHTNTNADLLIISADTRSIGREAAVEKIKQVTRQLLAFKPAVIYKKIDSVLRGHVIAELKAQMEVMQLDRAMVIPANPYLHRTIKDGTYFFKGEPIHLSSFSSDPEFPIKSSLVTDMLGAADVSVIKENDELPSSGIIVGEVETNKDLQRWADKIDEDILLAGAAGFFTALLDRMIQKMERREVPADVIGEPLLFVSGTTFHKNRQAIREVKEKGGPVSYMPVQVISSGVTEDDYEDWSHDIVNRLSSNGKAVIAIEENATSEHANAIDLREKNAAVVAKVLENVQVKELIVEGGATAASIIKRQNFNRLIPVQELSPGVIRMRVDGADNLHLTIKPGSYDWSHDVWQF